MEPREAAQLSTAFVTLADTLVNDFDATDLLFRLSSICVELLDVDAAGILLADAAGDLRIVGSSEESMHVLELFELQSQEGPCMDCYRSGSATSEANLSTTDRWPHFTVEAVGAGFGSVDALPMRLRSQIVGALNLFRHEPGGMPADQLQIAQALADVATIGLLQQRLLQESQILAEQLQHALNSRVVIEQAKGILAEQGSVAVEEAFEMLRTYSRSHNVGLSTLASAVTEGEQSFDSLR